MLLRSALTPFLSSATPANTHLKLPPPVRRNASAAANTPPHQLPPKSAYAHLPFCRRRCHYCDFPIIALGHTAGGGDDPRVSSYVATLLREITAAPAGGPPLETVFLGGGTPSLVPPPLVRSVLGALSARFGLRPDAEVSMEMDPGTFGRGALAELTGFGVNRVSLGVQAFQDELLTSCGRAHGLSEVREAVETVRSCGVRNWSMDLISSLPHQTAAMWAESLKLAVEAGPTHISVYDLQVERSTKFGALYTPGEFPLPSETESAEFYRMASRTLRDAGYEHYEISSYCKPGHRCKHNAAYWRNEPYYAFGLGSTSYVGGSRFSRPRRLKAYMDYVKCLEEGSSVDRAGPAAGPNDLAMDVAMLALRTSDGLDLRNFGEAFGGSVARSICRAYGPHAESGHVVFCDEGGESVAASECRFVRLSDPEGFLVSNELIALAFDAIAP